MAESSESEDDDNTQDSLAELEAPGELANPKADREEKLRQMMENEGK